MNYVLRCCSNVLALQQKYGAPRDGEVLIQMTKSEDG